MGIRLVILLLSRMNVYVHALSLSMDTVGRFDCIRRDDLPYLR